MKLGWLQKSTARPRLRRSVMPMASVDNPTLKYGDPSNLEDYQGGRDFGSLSKFAQEHLKPVCSPSNLDVCDDEKKAQIEEYMKIPEAELDLPVQTNISLPRRCRSLSLLNWRTNWAAYENSIAENGRIYPFLHPASLDSRFTRRWTAQSNRKDMVLCSLFATNSQY